MRILSRTSLCAPLLFALTSLGSQSLAACASAQSLPATEPSADGPVRLELLRTFRVLGGAVHAAAFSPDGAVLVTAGEVGDVRALELATGKVLTGGSLMPRRESSALASS